MPRTQALRKVEFEPSSMETSMKELRRNLSQLRRRARELDQAALEDCLSLAISLTQQQQAKS